MSIAEKITRAKADLDEVYNAGYTKGKAEGGGYEQGVADGIEQGKQAEYDAFWDAYQVNGTRRRYTEAFAGVGWRDDTFNPKYDIIATGNAPRMFEFTKVSDVKGVLERKGLILDLSAVTNCQAMFANGAVKYLPSLDLSNCKELTQLFSYANSIVSVDKLKVNVTGNANAFTECTNLEHIIFDGVMAGTGLNMKWSTKLDKASITSVINTLSTTTTGLTVTLSLTAVNTAFATAEGLSDGSTSAEWLALVATRSNWTIALA